VPPDFIDGGISNVFSTLLERFRAKWTPVRVKKTRQNKRLELGSDSIRTDKALGPNEMSVAGAMLLGTTFKTRVDGQFVNALSEKPVDICYNLAALNGNA
jgi:hypothetical protein